MGEIMKKLYKSFEISGLRYYEALFIINKLKIGKKLKLKIEPNNIYDENAIEIYYKKYKLGYIPKTANYSIATILKSGWDIFECYIQKIDKNNLKIQVAVFVKGRDD